MKIVILLFASFFSFGLAVQETVRVDETAANNTAAVSSANQSIENLTIVEEPIASVLLDTVEITAIAPTTVALAK